jgi:hypothetical protein
VEIEKPRGLETGKELEKLNISALDRHNSTIMAATPMFSGAPGSLVYMSTSHHAPFHRKSKMAATKPD